MTKAQKYEAARAAEIEAGQRHVQAAEAVNSAMRLLLQAEDALALTAREHVEALQAVKDAASALEVETLADRDAARVVHAFPPKGARV
jgi:hypothetical protein